MNTLEEFIAKLRKDNWLVRVEKPVSPRLEASSIMYALDGKPIYFENVQGSRFPVIANLFSDRKLIAKYLGCKQGELVGKLADAIENPSKPKEIGTAAFMQNQISPVDLDQLPLLFHYPNDGGEYLSSAVVIAQDKEFGRNCSFHRMMKLGKDKLVARILPRHLNEFLKRAGGKLEVAICIGLPPHMLLCAATSVNLGDDELCIANSLMPLETIKLENGISVPAESQIVMLAEINANELVDEGKFVDLTETYDIIRKQPVVRIKKIYYKNGAFYHALLPGGLEHKILMGMPREPTIFREVSKVCECTGVNITPGGCSWLHAVVGIKKKGEEDGKKALSACFAGHKSLKHAVVVDEDIDIYNPSEVEWAIATRFQAKTGALVFEGAGSSLDPSSDPQTRITSKMGIDATKPLVAKGKDFTKAKMPKVEIGKYL